MSRPFSWGQDYAKFLESKKRDRPSSGVSPNELHESLFDFQTAIVRWAIRRGRAAIFADCGLGKTRMQLEWIRHFGPRSLIVAPLCVSDQTIEEAAELDLEVSYITAPNDRPGIYITNYERLANFVGSNLDSIVLDESSILKSIDGKTRTMLLREFTGVPHRLCCTATPAPNDIAEMANHAEFLGIMSRVEMLATFFVHDASGWRLKGHAREEFFRWMATWAMFLRRPSDLGYEDNGFRLPELNVSTETVETDYVPEGFLFPTMAGGIQGRRAARRASIEDRAALIADMIRNSSGQWIVWHDLNAEGEALARAIGADRVAHIEGATPEAKRISLHSDWRTGVRKVLVTKPSIFGWGMNWQHCHRIAFMGIGDSYEQFYQAVRRCWRFGQKNPVDCRIVVSTPELEVFRNVQEKQTIAEQMAEEVIVNMKDHERHELEGTPDGTSDLGTEITHGGCWDLMLGDACERIREVESESVGLSVFSPPFASLYTYTASDRDLGNSATYDQFFEHFSYIVDELRRVMIPGRRACVHVQQVTTTKATHGEIGWKDFRADVVRLFRNLRWIYDGEIVIDKDPQAQAIRTKSKALMFVQKNKDSLWSRPAMADYILLFRAPGENPTPIDTDVTNEEWIKWARPIWYDIRETKTLNVVEARSNKDERHICPLQLDTIHRIVRLWSNPDELVFSPFAGIGSEGYEAVRLNRRFLGIELKPEYYRVARKNLNEAARQRYGGLFENVSTA